MDRAINETIRKQTDNEIKQEKLQRRMGAVANLASYYRSNIHRFASDYLNIKLKIFQKILLFMMNAVTNFFYLASRGQGKSFLLAVFCVCRCILYPGTIICIAAPTKVQAKEIIDKIILQLMPRSENLRAEIEEAQNSLSYAFCKFRNGSYINVVPARESARHYHCHILIIDERVKVDKNIIDTVLRPFLASERRPPFMDLPEYKKYPTERNKELCASSCWYESHEAYESVRTYAANMVLGRPFFVCSLPYQIAVKEGLLNKDQVESDMAQSTFNDVAFYMEMQALFFASSDGSLYNYEDISKIQKIKYPFYPRSISERLPDKRIRIPVKRDGEIRILSADIALMSSKNRDNDAASIHINHMVPIYGGSRYCNNIVYTTNSEGMRTEKLALQIRKMFSEYDGDYIAIDARTYGLSIIDALQTDLYDSDTGETYPAINVLNNEEIADRCLIKGAPKVIYAILGSPTINTQCALILRNAIKDGTLRLLIDKYDAEDVLFDISGFNKLDTSEQFDFKLPYDNTFLLVNELVNLEHDATNNAVRVREKFGMRKDRYSSLSYNIYVAKQVERDALSKSFRSKVEEVALKVKAPILKRI